MLDFHLEPWLICILVGIVVLKPDNWHEIAFVAGKWFRYARAHILQWQEDLGYPISEHLKKENTMTIYTKSKTMDLCLYKIGLKEFYISVQPQKN